MSKELFVGGLMPIKMIDATQAGISFEDVASHYTHISFRWEEKNRIDVSSMGLAPYILEQRERDYAALARPILWHLEPLRNVQPRSFAAFFRNGPPRLFLAESVVEDAIYGKQISWALLMEVNGRVLQLDIGAREEGDLMQSSMWQSIPKGIAESWLWRATGWRLPRQLPSSPMSYWQLLRGSITQGVDDVLRSFKIKKSVERERLRELFDRFPDIVPKRKSDRIEMRCFLDTRPEGVTGPVGDQFFTRSRMRDGVVYHIRQGNALDLRILRNPVEAFDLYHEHLLLKRPEEFDFSEWSTPL